MLPLKECLVVEVVVEAEAKVRVRCEDLSKIESRIESLGFRLVYSGAEEDIYYNHPCRDVLKTDEAIRVRISRAGKKVTYKGPRMGGKVKARVEYEARVDGDIEAILEHLGFKPVIVVRKSRSLYKGESAIITLDRVEGLGCFVEVESIDGSEEPVINVIRMLGLDPEVLITESYVGLIMGSRDRSL